MLLWPACLHPKANLWAVKPFPGKVVPHRKKDSQDSKDAPADNLYFAPPNVAQAPLAIGLVGLTCRSAAPRPSRSVVGRTRRSAQFFCFLGVKRAPIKAGIIDKKVVGPRFFFGLAGRRRASASAANSNLWFRRLIPDPGKAIRSVTHLVPAL